MTLIAQNVIKEFCGNTAYSKGKSYYRQGRVKQLKELDSDGFYRAVVTGSRPYRVELMIDDDGDVMEAVCNCPAYDRFYHDGCKHIAAVLLAINDLNQLSGGTRSEAAPKPMSWGDRMNALYAHTQPKPKLDFQAAEQLIHDLTVSLPEAGPGSQAPSKLAFEYLCKINPIYNGSAYMTLELKVGVKRTYVVSKLRAFLEACQQKKPLYFTAAFTFDLMLQEVSSVDEAILNLLIQISKGEGLYRSNRDGGYGTVSESRELYIPPIAWERLLPLLQQADSSLTGVFGKVKLEVQEKKVPVVFTLKEAREHDGLQLAVPGLGGLIVLEDYGYAAADGKLYRLGGNELHALHRVKALLGRGTTEGRLHIPSTHIQSFVQTVLPVLKRSAQVKVAAEIRQRIVEPDLKSGIYFDYTNSRLTAEVKFEYDGFIINPLREHQTPSAPGKEDRIVLRDVEREGMILQALSQSLLQQEDGMWASSEEYVIYETLFELLPRMEEMAEVFLTERVRALFSERRYTPRVKADLSADLDWLDISFEVDDLSNDEIRNIMRSIVEKRKYIRMKDGAFLTLETGAFAEFGELAQRLGLGPKEIKKHNLRLPAVRALQLPERKSAGSAVLWSKKLREFLNNIRDPDRLEQEAPAALASVLRDYQLQGFRWMSTLAHYRFGGILADDMGLGKTLQAIAFIASQCEQQLPETRRPVLVVSPSSLVYNWRDECARFAPGLRVLVVTGSKAEREARFDAVAEADIVLTSYPLLRQDLEQYERLPFSTLILDEAQAIKNTGSQTAQAVKAVQAPRRFALTGTPVENGASELWSIYDAVFPGLLPSQKTFREMEPERIGRIVKPFLLRRLKQDVLTELPDKIETVQRSELKAGQKKLYAGYLARLQESAAQDLAAEGFQKSRMKILAGITRLRQLCCHPSLFVEDYKDGSGKLEQLVELVQERKEAGSRLLIFSQFSSMLQLIREALEEEGHSLFYLDGQTKAEERVDLCRRFNQGEADIFLISLKAGGTGLNLTGADTVLLYDMWWNPAVEEQAIGRAHRMGQKRVVQVIRLVAEGTIEEKILELQEKKKDLIERLVESSEGNQRLTEEDIRELLHMQG